MLHQLFTPKFRYKILGNFKIKNKFHVKYTTAFVGPSMDFESTNWKHSSVQSPITAIFFSLFAIKKTTTAFVVDRFLIVQFFYFNSKCLHWPPRRCFLICLTPEIFMPSFALRNLIFVNYSQRNEGRKTKNTKVILIFM